MNAAAEHLVATAPSVDLREKLRSYWRRRRTFWLVAGAAAALTVALAAFLPPTYQSTATILIEQQEIPQELVRSVITSFADQRIHVISQRVMTTQNLMSLIERYNLYPDLRAKEPREVLLKRMRDDIGLHMISADVIDPRSGRPQQATIAFEVGYQNREPDLALKVASELATLYLNENLNTRTRAAQQTSSFFSEQSSREAAHIAELDKALAEFKKAHHDELPELGQLNQQELQRVDLDLRDAENRISAFDSQKVLLEAQLAQLHPNSEVYTDTGQRVYGTEDRLKQLRSQLASYQAKYGPNHPDVIRTQREVEGLEKAVHAENQTADRLRQLNEAKSELADALEKYSDQHPDVIRLRHRIDALEKAVAEEAAADFSKAETQHPDNPAYIQVKGQLDAVSVDRESMVKRRDELRAKRDDYERRLAKSPEVERTYREMTRELDTAQAKYQEILAKQTEVQVSQNLESERKGEKFTMIEPPLPPEKPIKPNRPMILIMGLMLSLGLGIAAVAAQDSLDASVRGPSDLRALLQVPALVAIPTLMTQSDLRSRRRRRGYWLGGTLGFALLALVVVHLFVKPLDVVWASLLRRFGV